MFFRFREKKVNKQKAMTRTRCSGVSAVALALSMGVALLGPVSAGRGKCKDAADCEGGGQFAEIGSESAYPFSSARKAGGPSMAPTLTVKCDRNRRLEPLERRLEPPDFFFLLPLLRRRFLPA